VTDDELRDLLALAAVGALSDEEQREVDAALEGRPDLLGELAGLREVATTLADAVSDAPPPELRSRLLDVIAETPQLPGDTPAEPMTQAEPEPEPEPAPEPAPVVPIASARRRRWVSVGAIAAAVIALLVGVLVVSPWNESSESDQIAAVMESDDAVQIPMAGELAGLTITHSPSEKAAVLTAEDVPVPEGDRVYELWAIRHGTPERFATFRPDDDGTLSVYAPGLDPATADQWAITEEPSGGSEAPTTPILAATS
jgi:hypothetical protein